MVNPSCLSSVVSLVSILLAPRETYAGSPAPAQFYNEAIIDHFLDDSPPNDDTNKESFWSQRYYATDEHFAGPGSPIFLLMGGEGAIPPTTGFLYPLITDHFAVTFGAGVVQPEHRFYGASQPVPRSSDTHSGERPDPRTRLLTYEQALYDAARLVQHIRTSWGCAEDRFSPLYCPVISVGGSYPGFLAAMMRIVRPDIVDMAYSASAPMKFYAQQVSQDSYYAHIAAVSDSAKAGCSHAVRETLGEVQATYSRSQEIPTGALGVCENTVPDYLLQANDVDFFLEEVFMIVAFTFANHNMAYYPPSPEAALSRSCRIFLQADVEPMAKLSRFLIDSLSKQSDDKDCFSMQSQVPAGPNATISGGDWSGVGSGISGDSWDFQTCTLCVEAIGLVDTMFPYRPWSIEWLTNHCQRRFGVTPDPFAINRRWGIHNLEGNPNATHIIFTNGLNDGWSVSGIQHNITQQSIVAMNFPNGAHHSDLSGQGPSDADTPDIVQGFASVSAQLLTWLEDLPSRKHGRARTINQRR